MIEGDNVTVHVVTSEPAYTPAVTINWTPCTSNTTQAYGTEWFYFLTLPHFSDNNPKFVAVVRVSG